MVANPRNTESFRAELEKRGADLNRMVRQRHLVFWDAEETLARIMVGYRPEWPSFERVIGAAMRQVKPRAELSGLRIFGDMVGILWKARQFTAAVRLKELWNRLLASSPSISLFCGYLIDVFGEDIANRSLDAMLCAHTRLLPATGSDFETAINLAMDENPGEAAENLKLLIQANFRPSWAAMPFAEATARWPRKNLPNHAGRILDSARQHYHSLRHDAAVAF